MLKIIAVLLGPNSPTSHGSILPIMEWATRYIFQVIDKMQTENIKAIEPKSRAVREYYNHTHELMKRLAWSSREFCFYCASSKRMMKSRPSSSLSLTNSLHSLSVVVQKRQGPRARDGHLPRLEAALVRDAQERALGGLRHRLPVGQPVLVHGQRLQPGRVRPRGRSGVVL